MPFPSAKPVRFFFITIETRPSNKVQLVLLVTVAVQKCLVQASFAMQVVRKNPVLMRIKSNQQHKYKKYITEATFEIYAIDFYTCSQKRKK